MSTAPTTAAATEDPGSLRRFDLGAVVLTLFTVAAALVWAFPLYSAVILTLLPGQGAEGGSLAAGLAGAVALYGRILVETALGRWYLNSLVTAGGVTILVIVISATCGYAISQLKFHGRRALWLMILASFMIPTQALIVSHFFLIHALGLYNTWLGVILPQLIAPVAVIVYKQFFDQIPREFREAAMIDGASHAQILFRIFLPVNWGVTASLAIITFIAAWNAFLWPFLAVSKTEMMNVAVGIGTLTGNLGLGYIAAAILAGLPVAVVYLVFQRRVTQAIVLSAGVKG